MFRFKIQHDMPVDSLTLLEILFLIEYIFHKNDKYIFLNQEYTK